MGDEISKGNDKRSLFRWLRANKWKAVLSFGIVGILLFLLCWAISAGDVDLSVNLNDNGAEGTLSTVPEQSTGPLDKTGWNSDNFRINASLQYQAPPDWTVSADYSDNINEYAKFRSPVDSNGFYYCLDINEYTFGNEINLGMSAQVVETDASFTADGIGKPLLRVEYAAIGGLGGFHTTIIDDTSVGFGDNVAFAESITNPDGRRLQIKGQFNCDENSQLDFSLQEYLNSTLVIEARGILSTISY